MVLEEVARRVTARDVAQLAGLSRSTVSGVLGGSGELFSAATRARVLAAAETLNYRPSRAGRALVTGVTDIVLLVVPNVTIGASLQDAVDRIADLAAARGLTVLVRFAGDDQTATLTSVVDLRPFAVIDFGVFDDHGHDVIRAGGSRILPELQPQQLAEDPVHLAGRLQARHLLRNGPRQLVTVLLADERKDAYGPARARGVADGASELGAVEPLELRVPLDRTGAVDAVRTTILERTMPLGVCCYNDDVAVAVLAACRDLMVRVPEDVAVIGSDKTDVGQLMSPRLSTIASDLPGIMELYLRRFGGLGDDDHAPAGDATLDLSTYITLVPGETG